MASIRDFAFTEGTVATTSGVADMPEHQAGDLLLAFGNADGNSRTLSLPNGYAAISNGTGSGHGWRVCFKIAESSGESITFTLNGSDTYTTTVVSIKDALAKLRTVTGASWSSNVATITIGTHTVQVDDVIAVTGIDPNGYCGVYTVTAIGGTTVSYALGSDPGTYSTGGRVCLTPINASDARTTDDNTNPFSGIGTTTTLANCLVFSFLSTDGGIGPTCEPPWTQITNGDAGANSGGVAYLVKQAAGAISAPNWWGALNDNTTAVIVAVRDDGNLATLQGGIQPDTVNGKLLEAGIYSATGNVWGNAYPGALSLSSIGSKTTIYDLAAAQTDQGLNPYWPVINCTPAVNTAGDSVSGPQMDFGTAQDLTGGIVLFNCFFTTNRDYVDVSTMTDAGGCGILFVTRDDTAYKAWSVMAKNTVTTRPDGYNIIGIQVDQSTDTRFASDGSQDDAAVDGILALAQNKYGAVGFRWGNICIAYEHAICGGSATTPLNFDDLDYVLNHAIGQQRIMLREGSAATFLAPVKIGGTAPVHVAVDLRTLQFRRGSDQLDYLDWHVDDGAVGFEFDGQANDSIAFTNCVFVGGSPYYWRFNSSHSADAGIDFSGSVIINAQVTLRSTSSLDNMTFIDCPSFASNGAALTNCSFDNTKVLCASPAEAAEIADCSFASGGSGHAIEIGGTAANFSLDGCTFSGYSGTGTDAAIYVNIASGSVTISITGGGDTPSIRTAGAAINVVNARTIRVTAKDANTGSNVQGAKVALWATTGTSVSITRTGSTAYVAHTAHGYATGQKVCIFGAEQGEYNGLKTITVTGADEYTYAVSGSPATPATGTTTSHRAILDGDTNPSGIVEDTTFPYTSDLAVTGRVRKGTSPTYYKNAPVSGTITSAAGFDTTIFLVSDE